MCDMCIHFQLSDYSLVRFLPLDTSDEDSIGDLLLYIDNAIQYGEDLDVKIPRELEVSAACRISLYREGNHNTNSGSQIA